MNRLIILTFLILGFGQLKSQTIEIGQDANEVKQIIKWRTQQRTGYDSYGNSKGNNVTWDANYYNGQITEVIQCWSNQYMIDLRLSANFCKYYIMENGKLVYVLTQYENVSLAKLQSGYEYSTDEIKIDDYYFSQDYKTYSTLYLAKNGYATVKWEETNTDLLPSSIKKSIQAKIKQKEDEEYQKELARQRELKLEKEIKSKIYDLKKNDISLYNETFNEIKSKIANYFQKSSSYYRSSNVPSFTDLANGSEKKYRFTNTYTAYYKLEDHSRASVNNGYYISAGSYDVKQTKDIKLVLGTDNSCNLFNSISIKIPTIKKQGYEVMTEATFSNIKVDYAKGITLVRIKSGEVIFKKFIPDNDIQKQLILKLSKEPKGKYMVQYEVGNIAGNEFVNTELEKKKFNATWLALGGLLVLLAFL